MLHILAGDVILCAGNSLVEYPTNLSRSRLKCIMTAQKALLFSRLRFCQSFRETHLGTVALCDFLIILNLLKQI